MRDELNGRRFALALAVAAGLGLAAGCASNGAGLAPGGANAADVVRERSQQRWDALVAGDVQKAYSFLSPGTREANTLSAYASNVKFGFWKKALVDRVDCPEADLCIVSLRVDYVHRGSRIESPTTESWIRSGGEWWYVLR